MNQHIQRHSVGYCLVIMALADAFAQQFKGVTHQQVASMNWLDWMVSFAEFVAAAGTVLAAYMQKLPNETPSLPSNSPTK